jgi:hypothetical protein
MSTSRPIRQKLEKPVKHTFLRSDNWHELFSGHEDSPKAFGNGSVMARNWLNTLDPMEHLKYGQNFSYRIIILYLSLIHNHPLRKWILSTIQSTEPYGKIDNSLIAMDRGIRSVTSQIDFAFSYQPENGYTNFAERCVQLMKYFTPHLLQHEGCRNVD